MSVLDQQLFVKEKKALPNGNINMLRLGACMLFLFGFNFSWALESSGLHPSDSVYLSVFRGLTFIAGAALACIPAQSKTVAITGICIIFVNSLAPLMFHGLNPYIHIFLFCIGNGMCIGALSSRLLMNTPFFGHAQKTILLSLTGIQYLAQIFSKFIFTAGSFETKGMVSVVAVLFTASLICVIADTKKEDRFIPLNQYLEEVPGFYTKFLLPFIGAGLVAYWFIVQNNHFFAPHIAFGYKDHSFVATFILSAVSMGLLLLVVKQSRNINFRLYLFIGIGAQILLVLLSYTGKAYGEYLWLYASIHFLSSGLITFSFLVWLYRYAGFPGLALLLIMDDTFTHFAMLINRYIHILPDYAKWGYR
jgi:hypothetical protein